MPESQGQKAALQGWEVAEGMVHGFADNARAYWRMWGPLGEPMVHAVDFWADLQRGYLRWLREASAAGGEGMAQRGTKEAERSFVETVREAESSAKESAREAERDVAGEVERSPSEDLRSTIRESVSRSEVGRGEELQARTATSEEVSADTEELPIDGYDLLNVHQVTQRLGELSIEELERLRDYEAQNKNRRSIMQRLETRIRAKRGALDSSSSGTEESSSEDIRNIIRESVRRSHRE
jgi:hypothetical protein